MVEGVARQDDEIAQLAAPQRFDDVATGQQAGDGDARPEEGVSTGTTRASIPVSAPISAASCVSTGATSVPQASVGLLRPSVAESCCRQAAVAAAASPR